MWNVTMRRGAELPGLWLPWQEETAPNVWADLDLSSGWTFSLDLQFPNGRSALSAPKTSGITGADGYVVIAWAAGDLDLAPNRRYLFKLRARETATSRDRDYSPDRWPTVTITD